MMNSFLGIALLIPAAVMAPVAEAILTALLYLIEPVFTAYYWVGLQPATFYHSGDQDFNLHLFSETNKGSNSSRPSYGIGRRLQP